jgi:hypothetical protein
MWIWAHRAEEDMMTIRCRSQFSALLFCLPVGLCFASTAAADDDDEEWHDTKGPRSDRSSDDSEEKPAHTADKDKKDSDSESDKEKEKEKEKTSDSDDKDKDKDKDSKSSFKSRSNTKISLAALVGYGLPDSQRLGLGVRAGAHVSGVLPIYIGGFAQYFFGLQQVNKNFDEKVTRTLNFMYLGGEAGFDIEATSSFLVRPYFGLGLGVDQDRSCSTTRPCVGGRKVSLVLNPSIVGTYEIGAFFFGVDFRYIIVPAASTTSGPAISGTLGVKF